MGNDKIKNLTATELRRQAEEQLQSKTAGLLPTHTKEEKQRLSHELEVHQIELEMQNAELLQTRDEVEAALVKYTELYDFAPVGYLTIDRNGAIRELNITGATFLGAERTRLTGRRIGQFIAVADRSAFSAFLDAVFTSRNKETCELTLLREGKPPYIVQIEAVSAASGQECRLVMIDITDRTMNDEKLEMRVSERTAELKIANAEIKLMKDRLKAENIYLHQEIAREYNFGEIIG